MWFGSTGRSKATGQIEGQPSQKIAERAWVSLLPHVIAECHHINPGPPSLACPNVPLFSQANLEITGFHLTPRSSWNTKEHPTVGCIPNGEDREEHTMRIIMLVTDGSSLGFAFF